MKKRDFRAVGLAAAFCLALSGLSPAHAVADSHQGVCQPGEGVTVVVERTLDGANPDIRCAVGASGTIREAFEAAGFPITVAANGWSTIVDGIDAADAFGEQGWWVLYTSTVTGDPAGPLAQQWVFASKADTSGPVSANQAYLYRPVDSWGADTSGDLVVPTLASLGLGADAVVLPEPPATTLGTPDAVAAASWVGRQLAANGNVLVYGGRTDWGLTIDAMFALAAAGVGSGQVSTTARQLVDSGTAYIGTVASIGTSWVAVAKTALGLEVAGVDPTRFPTADGTRNLIADLKSVLNEDGSFGDAGTDSIFAHPLAMLALSRTLGGAPDEAVSWMKGQQCTDSASANLGSYGWSPDCTSPDADSTAMIIQALAASGVASDDPSITRAVTWLKDQQAASGGFTSLWSGVNTNTTGLAAQTLAGSAAITQAAVQYIGGLQINCEALAANANLTEADLGAIAADQASFADIATTGLDAVATDVFLRATPQAVLGLGGPGLASLSIAYGNPLLPVPTCRAEPEPSEPGGTGEPSEPGGTGEPSEPGGTGEVTAPGQTAAPGGNLPPSAPNAPSAPTGGAVEGGVGAMAGLMVLGLLVGMLSRRVLALR